MVIREKVEIQRGGEIVEVVHKEQDQKSTKTTIPFFKNNNLDYADFVGFLGDNAQAVGWIIFVLVTIFVAHPGRGAGRAQDGDQKRTEPPQARRWFSITVIFGCRCTALIRLS